MVAFYSYAHLTRLLTTVIDERPQNAVDVIEGLSFRVKRELLADSKSTLRDLPLVTPAQVLAEKQRLLFAQEDKVEQDDELVLASKHVVLLLLLLVVLLLSKR